KSSSRGAPPTIIDYTFRCAGPEGHEKVQSGGRQGTAEEEGSVGQIPRRHGRC
ncbi:unnamed protein product, partial [Ectocarpus sp. 13 AM-2016]